MGTRIKMHSRKVRSRNQSVNLRCLALECLSQIHAKKGTAERCLARVLAGKSLDSINERFVRMLVYGELRFHRSLAADAIRFLRTRPKRLVWLALLLGCYQLRHTRIPPHAAIAETVEALKALGKRHAVPMVNAVLRRVMESRPPENLDLQTRCELPDWWYASWLQAFGRSRMEQLAVHAHRRPKIGIAVLHGKRDAWMERVRISGIQAWPGRLSPHAVLVPPNQDVTVLPGFKEGEITVMDESSQLAVVAMPDQADWVLDVCSAPGGKRIAMASWKAHGTIVSVEMDRERLQRMLDNLHRVHLNPRHVLLADGTHLPFSDAKFDAILLDAPCSASGLLFRHPDVRFLNDMQDLERHAARQKELLREALRVAKPGAHVFYSVCSIHPQENEKVIEPVLGGLAEPGELQGPLDRFLLDKHMARIFPNDEHDGFFIALLRRK